MYRHLRTGLLIFAGAVAFPLLGWAEPVAKVGSWILQQEEVDKALTGKFYELREERVQAMVLEHLLHQEAAALKILPSEIVEKQIKEKVKAPSKEEVAQFITENQERLPNKGKGMEDRVSGFLLEKRQDAAKESFLQELWVKYGAEILLQPPRFDVPGPLDLARGKADAPVTVIEFSDFECPYCRRAQPTLQAIEKAYGDKVRFVFRHYPLPFHQQAPKASEAAQCAADQNKFWPFHDALFRDAASLALADLKKLAGTLGLDQAKFDRCLDSDQHKGRIAEDTTIGKNLGITGTPTFFVNGVRLVGAVPLEEFKKTIDRELKAKK